MYPTAEHRETQTKEGIEKIKNENAEIGGTVLWMGGINIGPMLDEAVERERVRASVDFSRRLLDLYRIINKQKDELAEKDTAIAKLQDQKKSLRDKAYFGTRALRALTGLLSSCGIEGDVFDGLKTLNSRYHAMMLNVKPEEE